MPAQNTPNPDKPDPFGDEVYGEQEGLSRSGSPDWGGVDLTAGDRADATQNSPSQAAAADEGSDG